MQLVFLLALLVVPYVALTVWSRWFSGRDLTFATRARVGLSLFFIFTGVGHFIRTEQMVAMLPPSMPGRLAMIYATGILEFLAAIGVWIARLRKLTGVCLIVMLIAILPANVYSAFMRVDFGGHAAGPLYLLVRVPFQIFVIWWTYLATEQVWFRHR